MIIVLIYASILISLVFIAAMMMRPVADDYAYLSDPTFNNPFKFAAHYYMDWTGRSSQAFWVSTLHAIFGDRFVIYGTILQLFLLITSALTLSYAILYKLKNNSHLKIVSVGIIFSLLSIFMTPSVLDSTLWITSSTVYIGSLIGMYLSFAFAIFIIRFKPNSKTLLTLLFFITFIAQLFSEPTSIIMIGIAAVSAFISLVIYKNKISLKTCIVYIIGAIAGLLYMFLSPGTRTRQNSLDTGFSAYDIFINSITDFSRLSYIFTSHRILLLAVSSLILGLIFIKLSRKHKIVLTIASLLLAIIVPYVLFAVSRYTMGSYIPLRAFTVPVAVASIFLSIGAGALISHFVVRKHRFGTVAVSILILITIPLSLVLTTKDSLSVIQAVSIREHSYDGREASIKTQLNESPRVLYFEPLPILLANSDAVDFYYNQTPPSWFEDGFRAYYDIPKTTIIVYETQPDGYCVYENTPGWLGAKTCNEIQKGQDESR